MPLTICIGIYEDSSRECHFVPFDVNAFICTCLKFKMHIFLSLLTFVGVHLKKRNVQKGPELTATTFPAYLGVLSKQHFSQHLRQTA